MIRIGFDAKRAAQNGTGLGNYSRFVIQSLASDPQYDLRMYIPNPRKTYLLRDIPDSVARCFPRSGGWGKCPSLWRVWGVTSDLEKDGIDLYHGLSNELPFNIAKAVHVKSTVTVHDLISVRYPEYFPFVDARIYACKIRKACRNADRIIAVSRNTKADIVRFFGVSEDKVDVVYQGCHMQFQQPVSDEKLQMVREKYRLPEQFVFHLGSLEERKNLMLLARALPFLPEDLQVVAIGKRTAYTGKVEVFLREKNLTNRMRLLHDVPFGDLPAFYRLSSVFVYPSRYEGFGIPLLEALFCGVPVIGATGSSLEEAGGPDSLYVDPDDYRALAENIRWLLLDAGKCREMVRNGLEYARNFTDRALLSQLESSYRKTLDS